MFLAIWSFVLFIISLISGWRELAKLYPYNNEQAIEWKYRGGGGIYRRNLSSAGVRGRLAVGANKVGCVIKPPFLWRPFHPKLFLPFDKIQSEMEQTFLMWDVVMITMIGAPDIRIAILKSARDMVENIRTA